MKKEMMENATGVKLTKKASKNVIRSLSVGLAAMMALSTPIAALLRMQMDRIAVKQHRKRVQQL